MFFSQYIHLNLIGDFEVNTLIIPNLQIGGEPQKFNHEPLGGVPHWSAAWPLDRALGSSTCWLSTDMRLLVAQVRRWLWKGAGERDLRRWPS